jgi:methionyl-tRNA formyltransferase
MANTIKTLFMGTPALGATVLRKLAENYEVIGVVTQPDRPAGRKNILTPPPVKVTAQELGLPVLQVEKLRSAEAQAQLREFAAGAEVFVVAAFGMILPEAVLNMPPKQCVNVHASLLPSGRGASPVAQAILDGLAETGVTIMLIEKALDAGPVLSQRVVPLAPDETQATLMDKLAEAGAELLVDTLPGWVAGEITPQPQDHRRATYTGIIKKEAGLIDWKERAVQIQRKARAYDPWPGIYTYWEGQLLKLGHCQVVEPDRPYQPGEVFLTGNNQLAIATGQDAILPESLQLPGKKMLPGADFLRGYRQIVGAKLG